MYRSTITSSGATTASLMTGTPPPMWSSITTTTVAAPRTIRLFREGRFGSGRSFESSSTSLASSSSSSETDPTRTDDSSVACGLGAIRCDTLQKLLARQGAPGSVGCTTGHGDLVPVDHASSLSKSERAQLHPFLFPIMQSQSTGHYLCAYRGDPATWRSARDPTATAPNTAVPFWPLVETTRDGPGLQFVAPSAEQLLRRMACVADVQGDHDFLELYHDACDRDVATTAAVGTRVFDAPYLPGAVAALGYGLDKYVLLRVGPFPDLYHALAKQHHARGDHLAALVAAETASAKCPGFGTTYRAYAELLLRTEAPAPRRDEARDAARQCLRLPQLATMGLTRADLQRVAVLAGLAADTDAREQAVAQLKRFYLTLRESEKDNSDEASRPSTMMMETGGGESKTREQRVMDEIQHQLNLALLDGTAWSDVRSDVAQQFRSIGYDDMAHFVDNESSSSRAFE